MVSARGRLREGGGKRQSQIQGGGTGLPISDQTSIIFYVKLLYPEGVVKYLQ